MTTTTFTLFSQWRADAGAILRRDYDIDPARIRTSWWTGAYISGDLPDAAAAYVATQYLNRLTHGSRLRFLATRHGHQLTAADERAIRRTVRRKGR
jgi:hypothetical protein